MVALTVGAAFVGASLSIFIMYSWLYTVFVPSVVFTLSVVVPFVVTVVAAVVPAATVCAEPDMLSYVVIPAEPFVNAT